LKKVKYKKNAKANKRSKNDHYNVNTDRDFLLFN
jgi:hypothetical protein